MNEHNDLSKNKHLIVVGPIQKLDKPIECPACHTKLVNTSGIDDLALTANRPPIGACAACAACGAAIRFDGQTFSLFDVDSSDLPDKYKHILREACRIFKLKRRERCN